MTKLTDVARDAVAGFVPLRSDEIERRIAETTADLNSTASAYGAAALDAEAGLPGAADAFAAVQAKKRQLEARIADLTAALGAAQEAEQRERFALQARKRRRDLKAIEEALAARDKAAERIVAGIAQATTAYRDLMQANETACRPVPMARDKYGENLALGASQLRRLVEGELYRLGAWPKKTGDDPGPHPGNFPGGKPPSADLWEAPSRIVPMDHAIKEASARLLELLAAQRELL
jgi:hypothetical protein